MAAQVDVVWDPDFTSYDFGPDHPMAPIRLDLTARLCSAFGIFEHPDVRLVNPAPADDDLLATVHDRDYIAAVRRASLEPDWPHGEFGLGTDDDPAFPGIHEASARIVSGTKDVCESVLTGATSHGVNFCGGMHHAMAERGQRVLHLQRRGGRDPVAAGQRRRTGGVRRHRRAPRRRGRADLLGRPARADRLVARDRAGAVPRHRLGRPISAVRTHRAARSTSRCPRGSATARGCEPSTRRRAAARRGLQPQVLVTQHGCDTHLQDPLAHLALSVDAQRAAAEALHDLAHELCEGRWVALGGGGYEVVEVVPRTWTHLTAIAAHRPIAVEAAVPAEWREHVRHLTGRPARPGWATAARTPARCGGAPGTWATTRRTRSTGPSWRPGRRSSRCTAWTSGSTDVGAVRRRPAG